MEGGCPGHVTRPLAKVSNHTCAPSHGFARLSQTEAASWGSTLDACAQRCRQCKVSCRFLSYSKPSGRASGTDSATCKRWSRRPTSRPTPVASRPSPCTPRGTASPTDETSPSSCTPQRLAAPQSTTGRNSTRCTLDGAPTSRRRASPTCSAASSARHFPGTNPNPDY
eukprot:scaffold102459_cov66-Phaeocystis_antarctica.AAC.6